MNKITSQKQFSKTVSQEYLVIIFIIFLSFFCLFTRAQTDKQDISSLPQVLPDTVQWVSSEEYNDVIDDLYDEILYSTEAKRKTIIAYIIIGICLLVILVSLFFLARTLKRRDMYKELYEDEKEELEYTLQQLKEFKKNKDSSRDLS